MNSSITSAEYWMYDGRSSRRWNQDPRPSTSISFYATFSNNPILFSDSRGDTIDVIDRNKKILFTIDDHTEERVSQNWKFIYEKKYQWFEPEADNYTPLISIAPDILSNQNLPHFTWEDITEFAEVDRRLIDYAGGQSGDWKSSPQGARGVPLVTVDGNPYWADAIGQIPFAVGHFKINLIHSENMSGNTEAKVIEQTLYDGQKAAHGALSWIGNTLTGGVFRDQSNTYDNYFILKGAVYASKRYDLNYSEKLNALGSIDKEFFLKTKNVSSNTLAYPLQGVKLKYNLN